MQRQLVIQVQKPDGSPLPGVTVVEVGAGAKALLKGDVMEDGDKRWSTDAWGRFSFSWTGTNAAIIATCESGFGLLQTRDLSQKPVITVHPWGRIEGVRENLGRPVANLPISYDLAISSLIPQSLAIHLSFRVHNNKNITDASGRFVFEHVPPVDVVLYQQPPHTRTRSTLDTVHVKPGETARPRIVTGARTIVGRVVPEPALTGKLVLSGEVLFGPDEVLRNVALLPTVPEEFDTPEKRADWMRAWRQTPDGLRRTEIYSRLGSIKIQADGSCWASLVKPGNYHVTGDFADHEGKRAGMLNTRFVVPPAEAGGIDAPFDFGTVMIQPAVDLKPGDPAPDFTVETFEGRLLKLADFRGRYLLLDFWATWCGPCVAEIPGLRKTFDAFGKHTRFAMISLSLDADSAVAREFVMANGMGWHQACLGAWEKAPLPGAYGVQGIPALFLIGPEGTIVATGLRGERIPAAVAKALDG